MNAEDHYIVQAVAMEIMEPPNDIQLHEVIYIPMPFKKCGVLTNAAPILLPLPPNDCNKRLNFPNWL